MEEYDIETTDDIQAALRDLLGDTIKSMMEAELPSAGEADQEKQKWMIIWGMRNLNVQIRTTTVTAPNPKLSAATTENSR